MYAIDSDVLILICGAWRASLILRMRVERGESSEGRIVRRGMAEIYK